MPFAPVPLNLALQGGGAHGAFTWGVLDRLLEAGLSLGTVSATSAGAVNAVAMAAGLAEGGPEGARAKLAAVWAAIGAGGVPELLRANPLLNGLARLGAMAGQQMAGLAGVLSPSELNPFDLDPLKDLLLANIDFARLAAASPVALLIAATDLATGRARLFATHELTADVVLASACLPTLHRAVRIGERHYWDGGYSANPEILAPAAAAGPRDTLIVLLNPTREESVPKDAGEIAGRINRITFNQPFLSQVRELAAARQATRGLLRLLATPALRRMSRHRFHLIEAAGHTANLPHDSKLKPGAGLLKQLFDAGRHEAQIWLAGPAGAVGRGPGIDLAARFLSG
jgi:NTE family protein